MSFEALGLSSTDYTDNSFIAPEMLNYMDLDHATTTLTQGVGLIS